MPACVKAPSRITGALQHLCRKSDGVRIQACRGRSTAATEGTRGPTESKAAVSNVSAEKRHSRHARVTSQLLLCVRGCSEIRESIRVAASVMDRAEVPSILHSVLVLLTGRPGRQAKPAAQSPVWSTLDYGRFRFANSQSATRARGKMGRKIRVSEPRFQAAAQDARQLQNRCSAN
jgi:hypothetical protein